MRNACGCSSRKASANNRFDDIYPEELKMYSEDINIALIQAKT